MTTLWCNGRWLESSDLPASPLDRGGLLGLGLFETLLAVKGRPIFHDRHLARLTAGCARLGWQVPLGDFPEVAAELLQRNDLAACRARIRVAVTAGSGPIDNLTPGADRLVWMVALPAAEPPASVSVMLSPWPRNENSPLAGLKCASYAENPIALDHARQRGFQETIFLNTQGHVCEAATGNLFWIQNGTLQTPSLTSGCLPGVTREVVLELAKDHGIPYLEREFHPWDLHRADEIFLTSATRGLVSVSRLDAQAFTPGPVSARLKKLWGDRVNGY